MTYLKPGFVTRKIVNPLARVVMGKSTLAVRGRRSGEWRTVPVNVVEHDGTQFLVAPRGECEWVRNLRVAREGEIRRRGGTERFRATEVPVADRAQIIAAYRERWDSEVKRFFAELPEPGDHPVFRITTTQEEATP